MESTTFVLIVAVSLLSVGAMSVGLALGYWRGHRRGKQVALASGNDTDLDKLAGVGRAILGAQLRLDALTEIVYQQASRVVDTRNFQLGLFDGDDYVIKIWVRDGERLAESRFSEAGTSGLIGWVRKTAQGLLIGDYLRDWEKLPARPSYESINPPKSAVFAPLIVGGDVIGVIAVQGDESDMFNEESLRMLTVLASQAAGAIRNAQQYQRARLQADQLRLISEVAQQITALQSLPDLFRQIVTLAHNTFHYYAVNIFTLDQESGQIKLGASSHAEFDRRSLSLKPGEGLIGTAYEQGQTINTPDVTKDPRYIHLTVLEHTKSEICVPLSIDKQVLGILDVQSDQVSAFKSAEVFTLESLAGQLALALREAQAYDTQRRQSERIQAMADASRAVVSILDIDDLLDKVVDLVADHFGYDRVHLFVRSGHRIVFRSGSGIHSGKWAIDHLSYDLDDNGFVAWVARNSQPLVSGNVQADDRYVPGPGLEDSRSEMTVPIGMGGRVLGVFDIQSTQMGVFKPEDVTLMQALADTVAVGLRNAGLFATETRRRMLAETLREVSTVLASSLDLESVLDGILLGLDKVVTCEAALILLLSDDEHVYTVSAVRGMVNEADVLGSTLAADDSEGKMIEQMWGLLHHMESEEALKRDSDHDHLYAPLQNSGKQIGMLAVDRIGPDHFSPEDVEIINTFANQAAVAIANAQLYMSQKEEAWISTALLQVAEATSHYTNLDDVLSTVAKITPLLVGVEWCSVFLADADTFRVVEIEGETLEQTTIDALKGHVFNDSDWEPFVTLRHDGTPVIITADTPLPSNMPIRFNYQGQAVLLPLHAKGAIMGALLIGQRDEAEPLTDRKIALVSGIANQAAMAIESVQLFTAQQEEAYVTTALLTVAESVNSTQGLAQTLETVMRLMPMFIGAERCGLVLWDPDLQRFTSGTAWGLSPEMNAKFRDLVLTVKDAPFAEVLSAADEPMICGPESEDCAVPHVLQEIFETPLLVALPLIAKGSMVGTMFVDYPASGKAPGQRQMHILTGTAQQVALAIQTARLQAESAERQQLEQELKVAQGIQHSFLPQQLPILPGWGLSAFYRAARQVGGDFYDFIPLKSGKWGIVIADVADKGVPAALFMVLSRTNIRASAFSRDKPVETLVRVNELLLADSRTDLFVTAWYGVWDPTTGEIVYASAGHNPPLIVRADGQSEELSGRGIALGVIDKMQIEEKRARLRTGDVLIAYTDGVTDALSHDGAEFGVNSLQATASAVRLKEADDITKRIVQAVDSFTEGEAQFDDLTLIVLKREGKLLTNGVEIVEDREAVYE